MKTTLLARVSAFTALLFLLAAPLLNAAEPTSEQQQINDLKAQIAALRAELETVKNSQNKPPPATNGAAAASVAKPASPTKKSGNKAATALAAEQPSSGDQTLKLKDIADSFDVPNSPAAAALGLSQDNVQHLKTPKQFIPTVINGLDDKGHFQSGLSVDFAPFQYFMQKTELKDFHYDESDLGMLATWFNRVLVRTQISFAAAKGTTDADKSNKFALGIHTVFANADDPLDGDGIEKEERGDKTVVTTSPDGASTESTGRCLNSYVKDLDVNSPFGSVGRFAFNHLSAAAGVAPEWIAPDDTDNYKYAGTTAWGSLAYSPAPCMPMKFVFDTIYHQDEEITATDAVNAPAGASAGSEIRQNSLFLTAGIRFGVRDFFGTATGSYIRLDDHQYGSDSAYRYSISVEKLTSRNQWLTLTLSKDEGHANGRNPMIVLGGIKLGFGGKDFTTSGQKQQAQ